MHRKDTSSFLAWGDLIHALYYCRIELEKYSLIVDFGK